MARLALRSRVYTRNHLDYAARVVGNVDRRAGEIRGLRTISAPALLGGLLAWYERAPEMPGCVTRNAMLTGDDDHARRDSPGPQQDSNLGPGVSLSALGDVFPNDRKRGLFEARKS